MRLAAYAGTSVVLAVSVVIRALHERANFYSATVYLAQSNACLMILSNVVFLALGTILVGLQRLLYGPLRPIEVEQLYEKAWISLTETCLAMTIFREEVGFWFIVMFVSLLVGKVWGWISEGRVDILEQQPPANPRLFHIRLSSSLALSFLFDLYMLYYTVSTVQQQARPNMMVMFAFEFAVLSTISLSTCARYALSLQEAAVTQKQVARKLNEQKERILREREEADREARENGEEGPTFPPIEEELNELEIDVPGWEDKGRWTFYLNIITDFLKLVLYMTFFCVLCIFYGMPIHIIRDVAYTVQSFYKRITDFIKYRHATKDMNERYPDATAEQIGREETCIICREIMREWQPNADPPMEDRLRPKKLPCGHVLHLACLRSWLERQQNCPTCRQNVLEDAPHRNDRNGNANVANQGDQNNRMDGRQGPQQTQQNQQQQAQAQQQQQEQQQHGRTRRDRPRNRMRFLNLGPLRLGFGAGNIADLQREIQAQAAQRGGQQGASGPGGMFRRPHPTDGSQAQQGRSGSNDVTAQLQAIERQLISEMNVNLLQQEQLRVVRAMQGELARLRIRQAQVLRGEPTAIGLPPLPGAQGSQALPGFPPLQSQQSMQGYSAAGQPQVIGSSHPDLPPGVTIPEGWQLMPLERMQGPSGGQTQVPVPAPTTTSVTSTGLSEPSTSAAPARGQREPGVERSTQNPASASADPSSATDNVPNDSSASERQDGGKRLEEARIRQQQAQTPSIPQWGSSSASAAPADTGSSSTTASSSSSDATQEMEESSEESDGKGKGKERVPTVEDVSDEDTS